MAPTFPVEFTGQKESKSCVLSKMMGKKRKVSKGYLSSEFVPNYRHEVGMRGESEGYGSSGRVDTEMTASEDSCAPKTKSIILNSDGCDNFRAPFQVLSLSKMTGPERRDLGLRLKTELERVRALQKRVFSVSYVVPIIPSSSDIRSGSDGKKRPLDSFGRSSKVQAARGKKQLPPRGSGSLKQAAASTISNAMLMKQCETLLNRLMSHQHGWIFNSPVDIVKSNIPDYFTIIKNPMDLGTVKSKLVSGQYASPSDFAADVRLTFSNARTYNPPGNAVHGWAEILSKFFEVRWKAIEKKLHVLTNLESTMPSRSVVDLETDSAMQPSKKQRPSTNHHKNIPRPIKWAMSEEMKHTLRTELEALLQELPENIVEFLKENSFSEGQTSEDEIEIDIDALGDDTLFALRQLLDDYLLEKQKKLGKALSSEVELPNESGLSNSSIQPCKGNDPVDEYIDIGGNEPPILGYPPIEIEKDTAHRNKCSSSSSSSSESGTSSSDSDSGSSSGSEPDGVQASVPGHAAKDSLGSEANIADKKTDIAEAGIVNQYLTGLDQIDQTSQSKPVSTETDDQRDGESAPSERQVSPEKLYRAALLRNRFADTILKAHEKTLEKAEKLDPEKLRLEKEELEKRKKEEKARLRAEAKAAEEAQRKAEVEAVAEARKRRELEREAARLALQKMEKTVDINENSQFIKDLEMLSGAPAEPLAFVDEMSPDRSLSALGSFKFEGSNNPLAQLGLYMKEEDEEEERDPQTRSGAEMDVEEEGRTAELENNAGEEEGEVCRIVEPANHAEFEDDGPQRSAGAVNDEEDGGLPIIPEPGNGVTEGGMVRRIAEAENNVKEEEGDAQRIPVAVIVGAEEGDGEPRRIPVAVNDEDGEAQRISEAAEEDGELQTNAEAVGNVESVDVEPRIIPEPVIAGAVNDADEEEAGEARAIAEAVHTAEEVDRKDNSDPQTITGSANDGEDDGESQGIAEAVNDVEREEPAAEPTNGFGVEEGGEQPQRAAATAEAAVMDAGQVAAGVPEPVNDVGEERHEPRVVPELRIDGV